MGLEGKDHSLTLETEEEARKRLEVLAAEDIVPVETVTENVAGTDVLERQQVESQQEAAELLSKMHQTADIKPEVVVENMPASNFEKLSGVILEQTDKQWLIDAKSRVNEAAQYNVEQKEVLSKSIDARLEELKDVDAGAEDKQEKSVMEEKTLSPEEIERQEMEELFESLDLAKDSKMFDSREYIESSKNNILDRLVVGLGAESHNNDEKRKRFVGGAVVTAGVGFIGGMGGMLAAGGEGAGVLLGYTGASIGLVGLSFAGAALAIGGLGWLGMTGYHNWKERKHRKAFEKLQHA